MKSQEHSRAQDRRILEAADWYMLLQAGEVAPEDVKRWHEWSRDAANQKALDGVAGVSQLAPALKGRISVPAEHSTSADSSPAVRVRWLAAAVLVLAIAGSIGYWGGRSSPSAMRESYQTATAEHRTIKLPDGSSIALGGRTAVSVDFVSDQRRVVLERGEALFTVAKDAKRPFTVTAGQSAITALGTTFDVHRAGDRVIVKVVNGRVEVTESTASTERSTEKVIATLRPGERLIYAANEAPARVEPIEPQEAATWQEGRLQYRNEALKYVAADVNRYSDRRIVLADSDIQELRYTGTVYQDRIDEWLEGLADLYPVELVPSSSTEVVVQSRIRRQ